MLDVSEVEEAAESLTETEGKVLAVLAVLVEPVVRCGLVGGEVAGDQDWTGGRPQVVVSPLPSVESLHPAQHSGQWPLQGLEDGETIRGLV